MEVRNNEGWNMFNKWMSKKFSHHVIVYMCDFLTPEQVYSMESCV